MSKIANFFRRIRSHAEWEVVKLLIAIIFGESTILSTTYALYQMLRHLSIDLYLFGGLFLLSLISIIAPVWLTIRKQKMMMAQHTSSAPSPLSDLEVQRMISIYPHQNMATAWLNPARSLQFRGAVVMHNCSQEQMKVKSLQNLRITLDQNVVLFSNHRIVLRLRLVRKRFPSILS